MANSENAAISAIVMKGQGPCVRPNGIAVSKPIAEELHAKIGDAVAVAGSRATVAVLESIENLKGRAVYLGRTTRLNAGAHWDEDVQLRRLNHTQPAERVVVGPAEAGTTVDADADNLKGFLIGTFLTIGDLLEVGTKSFRPIFRGESSTRFVKLLTTETKPTGFVQVTRETELIIAREFREALVKRSFTTYDDIGGLRDIVKKVRELVERPLRNPALFKHLGVEPPKGVLLHGAPGCGKTLLAKAVANESGAYFINVGAAHLPACDAERRLKEIFAEAEQHAPAVIFIDEIDTIARKREESFSPEDRRILGVLFDLLDGIKGRGQVIVMAATNRPNALDLALRRPGRFEREIEIPIPNEEGRLEILEIHTRYMPLKTDVDLKKLAETTQGYSGADLRSLCSEAAMSCIRRYETKFNADGTIPETILGEMRVSMDDFIEGMRGITPSCGREFIVDIPKVSWDEIGGYHELKARITEEVLNVWRNRHEAKKHGVKAPKGILLEGPPGTGKTYIAKATAREAGVKIIEVSGASLKSKWFGEYEQNVARLFEVARKAAPVIIILDEIDSVAGVRSGGRGEASKALDSGVNEFLRQIDGVLELEDVFIIGTCNRPDTLDPALFRSGRIEVHLHVSQPDFEARVQIFKIHLSKVKVPLNDDVNVEKLAELTEGLVAADIKRIVDSVLRKWFAAYINNDKRSQEAVPAIGMGYFMEVIDEAKANQKANRRERLETLSL